MQQVEEAVRLALMTGEAEEGARTQMVEEAGAETTQGVAEVEDWMAPEWKLVAAEEMMVH